MLMNSYETVNDVLVKLFNEIMDVEERALLTSEYKDISVNDMHVIEAIGIREPKNMSTVMLEKHQNTLRMANICILQNQNRHWIMLTSSNIS